MGYSCKNLLSELDAAISRKFVGTSPPTSKLVGNSLFLDFGFDVSVKVEIIGHTHGYYNSLLLTYFRAGESQDSVEVSFDCMEVDQKQVKNPAIKGLTLWSNNGKVEWYANVPVSLDPLATQVIDYGIFWVGRAKK